MLSWFRVAGPAADYINTHLGTGEVTKERGLGSSGWSSQYLYETDKGTKYFVKLAMGRDLSMFQGEEKGLMAMFGEGRRVKASLSFA